LFSCSASAQFHLKPEFGGAFDVLPGSHTVNPQTETFLKRLKDGKRKK
jgi:hypothetical protein